MAFPCMQFCMMWIPKCWTFQNMHSTIIVWLVYTNLLPEWKRSKSEMHLYKTFSWKYALSNIDLIIQAYWSFPVTYSMLTIHFYLQCKSSFTNWKELQYWHRYSMLFPLLILNPKLIEAFVYFKYTLVWNANHFVCLMLFCDPKLMKPSMLYNV